MKSNNMKTDAVMLAKIGESKIFILKCERGYMWVMVNGVSQHSIYSDAVDNAAIFRAIEHFCGFTENHGKKITGAERAHFSMVLVRSISRISAAPFDTRAAYLSAMREIARQSLSAANKSNNKKRKGAAMRAINYFSRQAAAN